MITSKYLHGLREPACPVVKIYNCMTSEVIFVSNELVRGAGDSLEFRTEAFTDEEIALLSSRKYLFNSREEMDREIQLHVKRLFASTERLGVTLCLTYYCNMRCLYCAQKKLVDLKEFMCKEVADQSIRWIEDSVKTLGSKYVDATFYGGEPLMNFPVLKRLAAALTRLADSLRVPRSYDMFTNGTLLTERILSELWELDVKDLVVTVDGTSELHNARRPFKSGKGTFDRIVGNLVTAVSRGFRVTIGTNLDSQTVPELEEMLLHFHRYGIADKIRISFGRTSLSLQNADFFGSRNELTGDEFYRLWVQAQEIATKHKLAHSSNPSRFLMYGFCDYWAPSTFVVMPSGQITKCLGYMAMQEFVLGDVFDGVHRMHYDTDSVGRDPLGLFSGDCRHCYLFPLCFGGCVFEAKLRGLYPVRPYCQKDLIIRGLNLQLRRIT